jgi:2-desacetyl-2-hydroxyethyl bacteriochlorophyllide A dehydrogenase
VRTHRMGICGTDIACYLGKFPFFAYPRTPGHELGLEVVAVGADVFHVKPGDKCSLEPYVNNPATRTSRNGFPNCCPEVQVIGVHNDGGLRQGTFVVPARKLHPGNDLDYDKLALVETLAIGYHAVQRANPQSGDSVLVIGAGPIGMACLEFLKLIEGIEVIVMDRVQGRLDFCQRHLGIAKGILSDGSQLAELESCTSGNLADVVIDATGSPQSMSGCFEFAAFAGRVVYVGITTSEVCFAHAPVFHRRELTLLASRNALPDDFRTIIQLIRDGKINTDVWITHRIQFDEVQEQFVRFTDPSLGAIKAMIEVR